MPKKINKAALAQELSINFNLTPDEAEAALLLLDTRAANLDLSLDEYMNAYHPTGFSQKDNRLNDEYKGYVRFLANDAKAIIKTGKNADFSTFVHEQAHIFRRQLAGDLKAKAEKAFKVEGGKWSREQEEYFAIGFEEYIRLRMTSSKDLRQVFERGARCMQHIYNGLDRITTLNPEIIKVYDELFTESRFHFDQRKFEEIIDEIALHNTDTSNYSSSHVYLGMTPPIYQEIGFERLPMMATALHIKSAMLEVSENPNIHPHNISEETLKQIPEAIKKPIAILQSATIPEDIVSIVSLKDKKGQPILIPFSADKKGFFNGFKIDINLAKSIYGRSNFRNFLETNIKEKRLLYINEKSRVLAIPEVQFFRNQGSQLLYGNIARYREIVKQKISGFAKLFQAAAENIENGKKMNRDTFYSSSYTDWHEVKTTPNREPDFRSSSYSEYWYTKEGVYRKSNHWGNVSSCKWPLDGQQIRGDVKIGFSKWSDFYDMDVPFKSWQEEEYDRYTIIAKKRPFDFEEQRQLDIRRSKKMLADAQKIGNEDRIKFLQEEIKMYESLNEKDFHAYKQPVWETLLFQTAQINPESVSFDTTNAPAWGIEGKEEENMQKENISITQKELSYAKKFLPPEQYAFVLEAIQGEEAEFFVELIKNIAQTAQEATNQRRNSDNTHPYTFEWQLNNTRWYMADWDGKDTAYGYVVLNGDTANAEWGYFNLSEIVNLKSHARIYGIDKTIPVYPELLFHNKFDTIEKAVHSTYPELFIPKQTVSSSKLEIPQIQEELYKNNFFSARRNSIQNGLELRFAQTMSESLITQVKQAGFRWSRRNQTWYTHWDGDEDAAVKKFVDKLAADTPSDNNSKGTEIPIKSAVDDEIDKLQKTITEANERLARLIQEKNIQNAKINKQNDTDILTDSSKQAKVIYEESLSKERINTEEEPYESNQSGNGKTGQSKIDIRQDGRGDNSDNVSQQQGRPDSGMGRDTGRFRAAAGYGNNLSNGATSNNDSLSRGSISVLGNDERTAGLRLRTNSLRSGEMEVQLREHYGNNESTRYGNELLTEENFSRKEKKDIREQCKEILQLKTDEQITEEDKKILRQYEGGGGLKEQNVSSAETLNAFYTPNSIIDKVWHLVDFYAPTAKTVLEPSCGIGKFAQNRSHNQFTLRELDETAARIAHILYPDATVIQGAFQAQFFDENGLNFNKNYSLPQYDVVIGNPPYGVYTGEWKGKGEGKKHTRYEEYFIERGIDSLNENGILAFVVPSGFLKNGSNTELKNNLFKTVELIDAYRLPNGAFATTDVGTDIIILKKHRPENHENVMLNDSFFRIHPDHILGETKKRLGRFGEEEYVAFPQGKTLNDILEYITVPQAAKEQTHLVPETSNAVSVQNKATVSKSNIEKAFEWKIRPNSLLSNSFFRKGDFEVSHSQPLQKDIVPFIASNTRANKEMRVGLDTYYSSLVIYFDINTRHSVFAYENHIIAQADEKGYVKKAFSEWDEDFIQLKNDKLLTAANITNLENAVEQYTTTIKNFLHSYIGITTDAENEKHLYLRDYNPENDRLESIYCFIDTTNQNSFSVEKEQIHISALGFDPTTGEEINMLPFRVNQIRTLMGFSIQSQSARRVLYATAEALYPADGIFDIEKIKEEDNFIRMSADQKVQPMIDEFEKEKDGGNYYAFLQKEEKKGEEFAQAYIDEMLSYNNISKEKFAECAMEYNRKEEKERQDYLEHENQIIHFEEDNRQLFDTILSNEFTVGKEFNAGFHSVKYSADPKQVGAIIVYINEEKAFCINTPQKKITLFNNFKVTSDFLHKMNERFNGQLTVDDIIDNQVKLSLNAILAQKQKTLSKKEELAAQTLFNFVTNKEGFSISQNGMLPQKEYAQDNHIYQVVRDSVWTRVFIDKSNYAAFEFNSQTDTLYLYQASYDAGFFATLENSYKKLYPTLSVTKDMIVDKIHYNDCNGTTIIVTNTAQKYIPQNMQLMNSLEFARLYGKDWDPEDRQFWEATNWKGYVDLHKLAKDAIEKLEQSKNYVQQTNRQFIHKELYASGNIYAKLEENENNLKNNNIDRANYEKNKHILEKALPPALALENISVSVISPFVKTVEINGLPLQEKFLQWATGCDKIDSVNKRNTIEDYTIAGINRYDIPPSISWSDIVAYIDEKNTDYTYDKQKTKEENRQIRLQLSNDRKETAEQLFNRYIKLYMQEAEQKYFVDLYNRTFNNTRSADYSKLPLFIDGMNRYRKGNSFKLYQQQIKGIAFLCNKGNGLLAYDVGVGKTAAGIVAAVNQIQSGRSIRPLIITPKSVLLKWKADIHELFPQIQVNLLGNFNKTALAPYYNGEHGLNIPSGSITLASKECLANIAFTKKTIDNNLFYDYADILSLNDALKSTNPNDRAIASEKIYEKAGMANSVKDKDYILWEKTGFDSLIVDEAHAYKNLMKIPRPKKGQANEFSGMGSGEPSARALKMFNITQLIQKENENRNVFMLTATPFTNSPLEIYSMLTYIARKELENSNVKDLYEFCKAYAKTRLELSVNAQGEVQEKSVMKEFNDLSGLQHILTQFIDKVDAEEANIIRPEKKTHVIKLEPSDLQKEIFNFAINTVMEYTPEHGEKSAPVLRGMNILRLASISPALLTDKHLINPATQEPCGIVVPPIEEVVECSPKLKLVCDTIVANWKKRPDCGQIMYLPEGTESYPHIINYMIKQGVSEEVFAYIEGSNAYLGGKKVKGTSDVARENISEQFNDKNNLCKILIGSAAISEGMDLNGNTIALYNCLLGWNPSESIQVEGRAWRQGNLQGKVHIVYPLIEDSIDSFLYQKHDEKKHRTDEIFSYKGATLNVSDIDPESLKFELIKDPVKRAHLEIKEIKKSYDKQILMFDHQLKDYDALVNSRISIQETLKKRKQDRETYISNYQESLFKGKERRSAEAQEKGVEKYNTAIRSYQEQIRTIDRKLKEMGLETIEDQQNFSQTIIRKKEAMQGKIEELLSQENTATIIKKYEIKLKNERTARLENQILKPLHEDILNDLIPFHIHEYKIKKERYESAIKAATIDEQKLLSKEYNEYLAEYEKKHGKGKEEQIKSVDNTILSENKVSTSVVHILSHEADVLEYQKQKNFGPKQIDLFAESEDSPERRFIKNKIKIFLDAKDTTCKNFQERLHDICKKQKLSNHLVMNAAAFLIKTMPQEEITKFNTLTIKIGCKDAATTQAIFTKIATGKIGFIPQNTHISEKIENTYER